MSAILIIDVLREKLSNLVKYFGTLGEKYNIDMSVPEEAKENLRQENIAAGIDETHPDGRIPNSLVQLGQFLVEEMTAEQLLLRILPLTAYKSNPDTVVDYFLDLLHRNDGGKVVLDEPDRDKLRRYVSLFCELLA